MMKWLSVLCATVFSIIYVNNAMAVDFGCKDGHPIEDKTSYRCNIDTVINELDGKSIWDTTKVFKGIGIKADLRLDKEFIYKVLLPKFFCQGVIPFQMQNINVTLLHDGDPIKVGFAVIQNENKRNLQK